MQRRTKERLNPALLLMLGALRMARQRGDASGPSSEQAALGANFLHGLLRLARYISGPVEPEVPSRAPVAAESGALGSAVAFGTITNLEAWHDFIKPAQAANAEDLRRKAKSVLDAASAVEGSAEPVERVFTAPMLKAVCSIRTNRNPQAAFQKFSHHVILTFLFLFGALRGTSSGLSQGALAPEEVTEVFDWCCPACQHHSAEALRKTIERFLRDTLRKWPADKMRGSRSHAGSIEIRHSSSPKFRRGQPPGH